MNDTIPNESPVLWPEKAIENLGDTDLFNELLKDFDKTLLGGLHDIMEAMDNVDYAEIRLRTHTLKGTSSYIQGERVRRASEIIQFCIDRQDAKAAYDHYPLLVVESIKLRKAIRQYLCKLNSKRIFSLIDKNFENDDRDLDVPISKYYKLKKKGPDKFDVVQIAMPNLAPVPKLDITKCGSHPAEHLSQPAPDLQMKGNDTAENKHENVVEKAPSNTVEPKPNSEIIKPENTREETIKPENTKAETTKAKNIKAESTKVESTKAENTKVENISENKPKSKDEDIEKCACFVL